MLRKSSLKTTFLFWGLLSHGGNYPAELLTPAKKFCQNALAVHMQSTVTSGASVAMAWLITVSRLNHTDQ